MARRKTINIDDFTININESIKRIAKETGEKLYKEYKKSIQAFYDDYSPSIYNRTGGIGKAWSGINGKNTFYKRLGKNMYCCGIYVGEQYIPGDPYVNQHHSNSMNGIVNKSWVFPRAFDSGIHGYTQNEYFQANRTREKNYIDYVESQGRKFNRKDAINMRKHRLHWPVIKKMKPTPEKLMIIAYNELYDSVGAKVESALSSGAK